MGTIHLVATQNFDATVLLAPAMYPLIKGEVVPLLTKRSVLVLEGLKDKGMLISDDPDYASIYDQLGPIRRSGIRPVIHSDDPIHEIMAEGLSVYLAEGATYSREIAKILRFYKDPETWDEMIEMIKKGRHEVGIIKAFPQAWCAYAKKIDNDLRLRADVFADQIEMFARKYSEVIFIGGVFHCMALSVRHDWPVIRGYCPPEIIRDFYHQWYKVHEVATHFCA